MTALPYKPPPASPQYRSRLGAPDPKLATAAAGGGFFMPGRKPMTEIPDRVKDAAYRYATVRQSFKETEAESKLLSKEVLEVMKSAGITKAVVPLTSDLAATVSVATREDMTIDPEKLKKQIGAGNFAKLCSMVLDVDKIESAVAEGKLDPQIVANCTDVRTTEYVTSRTKKTRNTEQ